MKRRILSIGIVLSVMFSICCNFASAAEARASTTLFSYPISVEKGNSKGEIKITYDIKAVGRADEIRISSIKIYKAGGTYVTTITGSIENGLIRTSTNRHNSTYTYKGTSGASYYAVVTVFATIGSDSDNKEFTTSSVTAP